MSNIDEIIDNIEKSVKEAAIKAGAAAAKKIADDLTRYSKEVVMVKFYSHYVPERYKRTASLLNNSIKRYYKNPHNTIFTGGIRFVPDYGQSYPSMFYSRNGKVMSAEAIFDLAVNKGKHGNMEALVGVITNRPFTIPPIMNPTPRELIEKKRDEIARRINDYINLVF